jgi:hypothetical protein
MEDTDWTGVIFGMGVLTLGTIILIVVLIVGERFYRARSQRRELDMLTSLIQKYEATATSTARSQESTANDLADVRTRLAAIERMLREVE